MNNETVATKIENDEPIFNDELIAKIIDAENDIGSDPNAWITAEQSIKELRNLL